MSRGDKFNCDIRFLKLATSFSRAFLFFNKFIDVILGPLPLFCKIPKHEKAQHWFPCESVI